MRYQLLPVLVFAGALAGTAWLWERHVRWPDAVAEVEAIRVEVVSLVDGLTLTEGARQWQLFDHVRSGQIVARLDDAVPMAELEALQGELARLRADVARVEQEFELDHHDRRIDRHVEDRRRVVELLRMRLDVLDRRTILETDRVEVQRLAERRAFVEDLYERGAAPPIELIDVRIRHEVLEERIRQNEIAIEEARLQREAAEERIAELDLLPDPVLERAIMPIRAAIDAQAARIRAAHLQIEGLTLRAPINGTIVAIHRWPGEGVRSGEPLLTIAADDGRYIVGYVREHERFKPVVGMAATVRPRSAPELAAATAIDRVGPQVEMIPPHQLHDPNRPEWGRPFRMAIPPELELVPGELVNVTFGEPPERPAG